jgi:glutamate 5-kinase
MRNFSEASRIVIKIGTHCLAAGASVDSKFIRGICKQIAAIHKTHRVLIVSSGAIGMGAGELGIAEKVTSITMRQACAAIGQPLLMQEYRQAFAACGVTVAQVLLTSDVLAKRRTYLNLRNSVETLLGLGVLPIFNENDSISTNEIGSAFGDNDTLSAYIASKIDANLLLVLSDIDALYSDDPRKTPEAKPYKTITKITPEIERMAGAAGSAFAVGGMETKIQAVKIAQRAGCDVIIASGREERIVERILQGEELGTLFIAEPKMNARERWILNSKPAGKIFIDRGAMNAIRTSKSLLPSGVRAVEGVFSQGDVILANESVKLVTSFNSSELESILGRHSSEIAEILGGGKRDVIARPEDMVFLDR